MNEEVDDSEFYHQDFTTVSDWEIFIANIEKVIQEWKVEEKKSKLDDKPLSCNGNWLVRTEVIPFADVDFQIILYKHKSLLNNLSQNVFEEEDDTQSKHPIDSDYDFALLDDSNSDPEHCLSLWYGLKEYIAIRPANFVVTLSESRVKTLWSSATIVIANTGIEIPMFIQIGEKWQCLYTGVYEGNGIRTYFEMVHLRRGPQHCQYLTGLLDTFKTKIMSPVPLDVIDISVRLTYRLTDFGKSTWKQDVFDSENNVEDESGMLCALPFGVTCDPIEALTLRTKWSHLSDNLVVDSEIYTDFDPRNAPVWTVHATTVERPVTLLADCLSDFLNLIASGGSSTVYDVLGDYVDVETTSSNPLDLLTESKVPTISSVLKRARGSTSKTRRGPAPLTEEILVPMLYFLFPDAEEEPLHPYVEREKDAANQASTNVEERYRGYKTCGIDSLIWRLAVVLAQSLHTLGGQRAMAHLWFELVQEMRYRWEKNIVVPGLTLGFPDPRTCLLHQKLQMLNCCIERKKSRENNQQQQNQQESDFVDSKDTSSTDDEEFYDCDDDGDQNKPKASRERQHSLWNQPVGRLGKYEQLKLIKTGDPLYVPITQDPVPKTEDQLEEDTDVLLKLGSDAQGSELRAKMMSASLLSDMESFKAANPGSVLEDFIRWYSPRDWIEDVDEDAVDEWGQKKGRLSSRMLIAGNTWLEMWESAKPVPANRQKRLFDDTREAEKVLHFLDSRTLTQIAEMLMPTLAHVAICNLQEAVLQTDAQLPNSTTVIKAIIKSGERLSREGQVTVRRFEALIQEIGNLELSISQANSLRHKFNPTGVETDVLSSLVSDLIAGKEVEIDSDSIIGNRMSIMFGDAQKAINLIDNQWPESDGNNSGSIFPEATEREFLMRVSAHRPATYSKKSAQFLRVLLGKNEFRLIGAFSEDIALL